MFSALAGSPATTLPIELWLKTLAFLDNSSLSACCRTCRAWYRAANPRLWGRIQELNSLFGRLVLVSEDVLLRLRELQLYERPGSLGRSSISPKAARQFKELGIDWSFALARFIRLTRYTSHLDISDPYDDTDVLRILYLLQQYQPEIMASAFPTLRSLSFQEEMLHKPIVRWLIERSTLTHIDIELRSSQGAKWIRTKGARRITKWNQSCSANLKTLCFSTAAFTASYQIRSAALAQLLMAREWEHLKFQSTFLRPTVLSTLARMNVLKSLTLTGSWSSWKFTEESISSFRIRSVTDVSLVLEEFDPSTNRQLIKTIALACPNLERLDIAVDNVCSYNIPAAYFTNLLLVSSLARLTFRPTHPCQTRLSDRFLYDAIRTWKNLDTLDLAPELMRTRITAQSLAAFACTSSCLCSSHGSLAFCPTYRTIPLRVFRVHMTPKHQLCSVPPGLNPQSQRGVKGPSGHIINPKFHEKQLVSFLKMLFSKLTTIEVTGQPRTKQADREDIMSWKYTLKRCIDLIKDPARLRLIAILWLCDVLYLIGESPMFFFHTLMTIFTNIVSGLAWISLF